MRYSNGARFPVETPIRQPLPSTTLVRSSRRAGWKRLGVLLAVLTTSGCVRSYQPMSGFHRTVVVDPQAPNFENMTIAVHCLPGKLLTASANSTLCQKVGRLFENQGATVQTFDTVGKPTETTAPLPGFFEVGEVDAPGPDLTLEIRSRQVHQSNHPLSWLVCIGSFTALPGIRESTFAHDLSIRGGDGFLLRDESLEGRMVERFGLGPWLGNFILDRIARKKGERYIGSIGPDLSADLYEQLSQSMFNAKMQWEVLSETDFSQLAKEAE